MSIAERPKLHPHVLHMSENIAATTGVANDHVSVKAASASVIKQDQRESGGSWKRRAAHAVVLLVSDTNSASYYVPSTSEF